MKLKMPVVILAVLSIALMLGAMAGLNGVGRRGGGFNATGVEYITLKRYIEESNSTYSV